ncbi:uncharacterized protein LOC122502705 [Leptopilina heterotoma]|uniref:uncharacterized protein LOC122502705 n=1 Tax=Leptopilina heterotoma TaxID=63436 RepID=UPI001CA9ED21|nr:uncharacterized protein LOC122502705 [Leptopilina heterotoma]
MPKTINTESECKKSREIIKARKKVKKQTRCAYSKENLLSAVQEAKNGMPIAEIARKYNVPESTIRSKRDNKYADKKPGPATVLSTEEENEIAHWIFLCYQRGFPIAKSQLLEAVEVICQKIKREIPFSNGRPGRGWFTGFLRRHPQISKSVFENTSLDKAKISEESLQEWFDQISKNISSINLLTIEPNRIFSCEEIGLVNPNSSSTVFSSKGSKIVQKTTMYNNQKKNVSILIAGNAAGDIAPTFIIFTEGSLSKKNSQTISSELTVDYSEDGSMTSGNFYKFIVNVFDPWLTKTKVKRPVLLYIDSNKFQLTLDLSKFCTKNEIELIALHSDVTEVLNPLCVSFIHIFEAERIKANSIITEDSPRKDITTEQFVSNLKQTFDTLNVKELLPNCFMESGLYPNVNFTDYNEVSNHNENTIDNEMEDNAEYANNWERLQCLESLISNDKLETFRLNESPEWKGERRDESLFEIWYKLSNSCTEIVHEANRKIIDPQSDCEDVKPMDLEFVKIENDDESNDVLV